MAQNHRRESAWGFDSLRPHCEMHPATTVARVLELSQEGLNECEISRRTGINRRTINDWTSGKLPHSFARKQLLYGRRSISDGVCPQCGGDQHDPVELSTAYVYLLGLYLGDGCISRHPRGVFRLRIALDVKYPGIIDECVASMRAVFPYNGWNEQLTPSNYVSVSMYSKSWPCLFPQHGPGKKHHRPIILEPWQQRFADLVPGLLLRGLIHSDGCRFINTGRGGWTCPRYTFSNRSDDIRAIFCRACDLLDLHWTEAGQYTIYVSRRADVAKLDELVGPKY
jgi:hypothetical protein